MFALTDVRFAQERRGRGRSGSASTPRRQRPFRNDALAQRRDISFESEPSEETQWTKKRPPIKSVETKYYEEREEALRSLGGLDRRKFLKVAGAAAGAAMASGLVTPHSFLPVRMAHAQGKGGFRFAYISDSHLYKQDAQRPLRARAHARGR